MRARLALLVAAVSVLTLIAFLVPLALLVRTVAEDRATVRATADAQSLVPVVGTADATTIRLTVEQLAAESGRPVSVFLPDGTVLGAQAPRTPAVALAARGQSLTGESAAGREVVIAVQGGADGTGVIRIVVPRDELTAGVTRAWLVLALLGVVLVVIGLVVADRLARTLVRPISDLSAVSNRLANAELDARVVPAGPAELREVAGALNHLAGRIQVLLLQEREQVADLSHRLRTPLTALRLEAESLRDPDDAARITAAADGLERAVTGLIRQARWRRSPATETAASDAATIVGDRVAFWSVLAEDTGRTVTLDLAPGPLPVGVPADDLAAAVDALLGNVFAHTPDGTPFAVRLARDEGQVLLTITDEGPGMPAGAVRRGASPAGSTGLGLDIARRAAQAGGGRLELVAGPGGGAQVLLRLGPPSPERPAVDGGPRSAGNGLTRP
ncbi:sensor histidine kinase [Micromonospora cremea]|uniref:histidine kinase n=1 Tax=Micromonospora cremea TaxID=709881 RepID=A0A1N6B583_9ACTN|nr:HAMP domain-containing sensor histidine kinase [Micromonospora cremea]SIN41244.1 Signal transduction histidine kinase [Micromonospora cremea]